MMPLPLAALLRLLVIAGGTHFVNPYTSDEPDLAQVWLELPTSPVALGGDVHIHVHGVSTPLRVRLARDDDDGRLQLAVMPLALDAEGRMTLPCGYFTRGGTYYVEVLADGFVNDYDNNSVSDRVTRDAVNKVNSEVNDDDNNVKDKRHVISEVNDGNHKDIDRVIKNVNNKTNKRVKKLVKRDESEGKIVETEDGIVKSWSFDVLWPSAKLDVTPEQIQTYPERQVTAILEFPKVMCAPLLQSADFWLELLYCGHSSGGAVLCDGKNTSSHAHVLYSEQMHGFPGRRTMTLRCELFGQAGDYALTLRPAAAGPQDLATAFVKADWSEQFVLNVHGGSVFPCGEGVRVLFQYPECVLEGADRVRVFGRDLERLRYVAERRVRRGQHTVSFDCRLFSERYPEYCFVYVSQAVTGAVADVRMDCLPTLPLSDGGAGGWGAWSAWSACPSPAHCSTRTRSRHRFCDSPPPAYGAKYCEVSVGTQSALACPSPAHCSTRTRSRHRFCDSPPPAYGAKYCEVSFGTQSALVCPSSAHCSTRTRSRHRFCDSPPPAYGAKYCEVSVGTQSALVCPSSAHCSTRTRSRHRFCDSPPPAYGAKYCEVSVGTQSALACSSSAHCSTRTRSRHRFCDSPPPAYGAKYCEVSVGTQSALACPSPAHCSTRTRGRHRFCDSPPPADGAKYCEVSVGTQSALACPSPAHCSTRIRSRHRFCDSPPPAYGTKYCEGQAVELAACECATKPWAGDSSMVVSEVGPQCRCGCVLHLAPSARLLAGSAKACPGRSFWLIQAEEGLVVRLRFEAVRLPCAGQALRARDGDSLGSPLLATWDGPDSSALVGDVETTTDSSGAIEIAGGGHILVELRSGEAKNQAEQNCAGGFLAHASQIEPIRNASAAWASISVGPGAWLGAGGGARAAALALAAAAALAALGLALHSARRNTPYQRAADKESLTDSDACSASLELGAATSGSRSTLLSEVVGGSVSLRRLLPSGRTRHTRLRDSDRASEKEQRLDEDEPTDTEEQDNASEASGAASVASEATITPESAASAPVGQTVSAMTHSPLKRSQTMADAPQVKSPQLPSTSETTTDDLSTSVTSVSERDSCSEKDKDSLMDRSASRASSSSAATLTNGWYSPALSGVNAARIRDNPKHTKESCNRRLLRSDLSLTSHPEMEIDYYDYEVNNAGSVPGSYLGMDPAFLVWIPPIEEGDIIKEIDESKIHIYEEIIPKELHPDPGSNTESPEERPSCSTLKRNEREKPDNRSIKSNDSVRSRRSHDRTNIIHPLNFSITDLQNSPRLPKRSRKKKNDSIPMKELTLTRSPVKVHRRDKSDNDNTLKRVNDTVRETKEDTSRANTDFNDIRFADDTDSSNEIKFADDSPDSNRLIDKFDVKA